MEIKEITSPKLSKPKGIYSQATQVTDFNKIIFVSGFTSRDEEGNVFAVGDIEKQTERVLENIKVVLEEAGAGMDNVVKMTFYIRNMEDFSKIHDIRARYFKHPYPACAMLEVPKMISPESLIEIEAIAVTD